MMSMYPPLKYENNVITYKRGINLNDLLSKANILIRKSRPSDDSSKRINIFQRGNLLQLTFQTHGCRYSASGSCTMCNYGQGVTTDVQIILRELDEICHSKAFLESNMILLGASGSFLDEGEIPGKLQYDIMKRIAQSHMQEVFIETHYKSVSDDNLQIIQEIFPDKAVHIEMGLETTTEEFQTSILNKTISLPQLKETIRQIHAHNIVVDLNILFGMPFLTINQQIEDTLKTIRWALENGADNIIVFPINIHPYTVFEWWYDNGYITVPSLWGLLMVLQNLTDKELSCICLAWYGNRGIVYSSEKKTVIPQACPICQKQLISFFDDFASNYNLPYRKERLHEFANRTFPCKCRQDFAAKTDDEMHTNFTSKLKSAHGALERWVKEYAVE